MKIPADTIVATGYVNGQRFNSSLPAGNYDMVSNVGGNVELVPAGQVGNDYAGSYFQTEAWQLRIAKIANIY